LRLSVGSDILVGMTEPVLPPGVYLADTITKLTPLMRGAVVVSGSHGGRYCAYLSFKAGLRAFILNDAGVGKEQAGISSLADAEQHGIAAATVSNTSCRIGSSSDMMQRGLVSHANGPARAVGVRTGMACAEAARLLTAAPHIEVEPALQTEGRVELHETGWWRRIVIMDSASLVKPEDAGQIIVTASHGALLGGNPWMALQAEGFAAVFNDAGIGIDGWGITRLPALESRGVAGLTVAADTARIGDGRSTFEDGVISHVNAPAGRLGAVTGQPLKPLLLRWATLDQGA
jgi:hypothetical protein